MSDYQNFLKWWKMEAFSFTVSHICSPLLLNFIPLWRNCVFYIRHDFFNSREHTHASTKDFGVHCIDALWHHVHSQCGMKRITTLLYVTLLTRFKYGAPPASRCWKAQNSHCITGKCRQPNAAQYKFYTLARSSLLLNVNITILYPNTQTLTVCSNTDQFTS